MKIDAMRKFVSAAQNSSSKLIKKTLDVASNIDKKHAAIADGADVVAKAAKVAAGVAVTGAVVAAPTGVSAVGVALGVVSAPLIVTAAPILASVAGAAVTVSAGASLYSKYRRRRSAGSDAASEG